MNTSIMTVGGVGVKSLYNDIDADMEVQKKAQKCVNLRSEKFWLRSG